MENCYHFKLPSLELGVLGVGAGGTFGLDFYFVFFTQLNTETGAWELWGLRTPVFIIILLKCSNTVMGI